MFLPITVYRSTGRHILWHASKLHMLRTAVNQQGIICVIRRWFRDNMAAGQLHTISRIASSGTAENRAAVHIVCPTRRPMFGDDFDLDSPSRERLTEIVIFVKIYTRTET
jgi:hypothetical protein